MKRKIVQSGLKNIFKDIITSLLSNEITLYNSGHDTDFHYFLNIYFLFKTKSKYTNRIRFEKTNFKKA